MSDRLDELRRQRALAQQQLDRLDAEIAAAEAAAKRPVTPPTSAADSSNTPADADALLARFADEERLSPKKMKVGCWMAFLAGIAVFAAAVGVWYFLKTSS